MVRLTKGELARATIREVLYSSEYGIHSSLKLLVEQYGEDAELIVDTDGCYDAYAEIIRNREENDEEYEARLSVLRATKEKEAKRNRDVKLAKEAKEREEYERLRKKYG